MWGILVAVLSGLLMSVQGVFNTQVTKQTSLWVSSAFVQLTALAVCLGAWACKDRSSFGALFSVRPWYMLLGGVLGALITIRSVDSLGPARSAMLIVIAQLAGAYLIELFGLFGMEKQPLEWRRVMGLAVSIAGIVIFKL